jgi:hypothetical protein
MWLSMKKQNLILAILALAYVASGCVALRPLQYYVNVDSISASNAMERKNYVLLPGNKDTSINDLQFKEYAAYVDRALISIGFVHAASIDKADLAIFLVYGIGNPQEHQYAYSLPVFGQTGVSSSTTFGTLSTFGNYGTFSGTTTYSPTYGITGYTSHVGSYTTYFRYLVLDALDLAEYKQNKKEIQLWKTTITSTGSSGDLRRVFPYMISASKPYIGINTGQQLKVILSESDPRVQEIKGQNPRNQNK